jgi:hypothetical protein
VTYHFWCELMLWFLFFFLMALAVPPEKDGQ